MRKSGRILAETLGFLSGGYIKEGVTTLQISQKAEEIIRSFDGAVPAFLGYKGFPEAACVSINEQVVHGIPDSSQKVKSGNLVSIDIGVLYEGHFTDACRSVAVEPVTARVRKIIKVTKDSLNRGIEAATVGNKVGDISYAIQRLVERKGFNVSRDLQGHGIGKVLHGPPGIPNCGPPDIGEELYDGMCLAIEPVVFDGPYSAKVLNDNWTVVSTNGNLSAHFEDTVIITENGPEIITRLGGTTYEKT
jgi:methionyl aminopeptidase